MDIDIVEVLIRVKRAVEELDYTLPLLERMKEDTRAELICQLEENKRTAGE